MNELFCYLVGSKGNLVIDRINSVKHNSLASMMKPQHTRRIKMLYKSHELGSAAAIESANFLLDEMCADGLTDALRVTVDEFSQLTQVHTARTYNSFGEVYDGGELLFYVFPNGHTGSLLAGRFDYALKNNISVQAQFCAFPRVTL